MAVITRSQAKQDRTRRLAGGPSSRIFRRTTTRVIVCASATGQGVHTRWLRSKRTPASRTAKPPTSQSPTMEDPHDDDRYVTPAPTAVQIPGAPHKARVPNPNPPGTPPTFVLKPMEGIEEEDYECAAGSTTLGSPFSNSPPVNHVLGRQATVLNVDIEGGAEAGTVNSDRRLKRRAYGANGTYLVDSEGKEIWV
jgi:hypothetical protein